MEIDREKRNKGSKMMRETRHDEETEKRNKGAKMRETRLDEATVAGRPAKREDLQKKTEESRKTTEESRKKTEESQKKTEKLKKELEELIKKAEELITKLKKSEELKKKKANEIEELEKQVEKLRTNLKTIEELEKKNEELKKKDEKLEKYKKEFPTMAEIVELGKLRPPPNESNRSVHTKTGHRPARIKQTLDLPDELGRADKFWSCSVPAPRFSKYSNSEGTTRFFVYTVLNMIMKPLSKHLGFQIEDVLDIQACISLLDTIPDLALWGPNKIIASTVEIKQNPMTKGREYDNIFGSETEVAGEIYEQLYLVDTNNLGSGGVGLLTTSEHYMLVSLDGNISYDIEKIKNFFSKGKGKTNSTPDRMQTAIFKSEYLSDVELQGVPDEVPVAYMKRDKDGNFKTDTNGNNQTWKHDRVAAIASQNPANYSLYASKVLSMSIEPKKTLNLLAIFVILTLRNVMNSIENGNRNNIMEMKQFSTRYVKEPSVFSLTAIDLSRPIDFLCPSKSCEGNEFHAIRQLGFGSYGVCCLSFNENGYACVLKFIHKRLIGTSDIENMAQKAEEEAAMWGRIYGKKYDITARVLRVNCRPIIVMPYLQIPSTRVDKLALCKGGKGSKLYLGLKQFCDAGYIHEEIHWHHVGELPSDDSNSGNPCLLCDLGNISKHEMSEVEKEQWVSEAFTALKKPLNPEQENCLQTPKN